MNRTPQTKDDLRQLLQRVEEREKTTRRNAILYSLIPVAIAAVLLTLTSWQVYKAENRVARAKTELRSLEDQKGALQDAVSVGRRPM